MIEHYATRRGRESRARQRRRATRSRGFRVMHEDLRSDGDGVVQKRARTIKLALGFHADIVRDPRDAPLVAMARAELCRRHQQLLL